MTYKNFQRLSDNEKADCLWDKGLPVGSYDKEDAKFVLYQLDGFYVEAEYKTDFMEIVMLRSYETNEIPAVYLDDLNISGIPH